MAKRPVKKPEYPEESRICGFIFIFQLIAVLSAVSIVYLTVASYVPSLRAISSTYEESSVMCTTVLADDSMENCTWLSCFEWCLTKSSGLCMQIWVSVRHNGSELQLNQCHDHMEKTCATDELIPTHRHLCRKDQCENLLGLFNCTKGVCVNVTSAMMCNKFTNLGNQISLKQRINCQALDGFYTCTASYCMRILEPYTCERRCTELNVHEPRRNVVIMSGDRLLLTNCLGPVTDLSKGELVWEPNTNPNEILFISCTVVRNGSLNGQLMAWDCVNGALVQRDSLKGNSTLSQLIVAYNNPSTSRRLPPLANGSPSVPMDTELTIYNKSKLLVNLEYCVNSLRDECKEFFAIHGRDGRDLRAPARFPCYYSMEKNDSVVAKFNRAQVAFEFALSAAIPGALFVFSCCLLVLCTKIVGIGPDAHMKILGFRALRNQEIIEAAADADMQAITEMNSNHNGKNVPTTNNDVLSIANKQT